MTSGFGRPRTYATYMSSQHPAPTVSVALNPRAPSTAPRARMVAAACAAWAMPMVAGTVFAEMPMSVMKRAEPRK